MYPLFHMRHYGVVGRAYIMHLTNHAVERFNERIKHRAPAKRYGIQDFRRDLKKAKVLETTEGKNGNWKVLISIQLNAGKQRVNKVRVMLILCRRKKTVITLWIHMRSEL